MEEDRQILELDFGDAQEKLKGDYLAMYEIIQSEVKSHARFDKNSNLRMTYLAKVDTTRARKTKAEEKFPISQCWNNREKLLNGIEYQILLDTGASESFISVTLLEM